MLAEYATFLKHGHVEALAEEYLRASERLHSPLLGLKNGRSESECFAKLLSWWDELLTAFESQAAMAYRERQIDRWVANEHPTVFRTGAESPEDVLKLLTAEKQALFRPLPSFSSDVKTVVALVEALDAHYQQVTDRLLLALWRVHTDACQQIEKLNRQKEKDQAFIAGAIHHAPMALGFLDSELRFRWANAAYAEQTGKELRDLIGIHLYEAFPGSEPQLAPVVAEPLQGRVYSAKAYPLTYVLDGAERQTYWDFTYLPIYDAGRLDGILVMAIECSERVEHERQAQEQIANLESQNARKDAFASMLTHELRTPLNCILGFSSLLKAQSELSEEGSEFVGEIDANARRMLGLVNDLLDLARAHADKLTIAPADVDYAALLKGVLASIQPLVAEKRLQVSIEAPIDHPVCLDALRIRQVLTNLLHNAVKFTPPDGRIRLVASIEDQALRTEVCDTGRGFTEAEREALFVPFSQLKDTPAGGTGLGLAITRAIVEAHGGHVEASSPGLGQGACFRFTLPL